MIGSALSEATLPDERVLDTEHHRVRFLLQEHPGAERLVVVFSSYHLVGVPPPYRYMRTLRDTPAHRLFILDDQGPPGPPPRPCWYLGRERRWTVAAAVEQLISATITEYGIGRRDVITAGSSKGGYAAVYFALTGGYGHAISGEPQTLLGTYLKSPTEGKREILEFLAGGTTPEDEEYLNRLLFEVVASTPYSPHIHMHCGEEGPYLEREVAPLLDACERVGITSDLNLGAYADHADLSENFPLYLHETVERLVGGR